MIKTNKVDDITPLIDGKKVFVFDFDGTTANTEPVHLASYNKILEKFGIVLKEEKYKDYVGFSEKEIYQMIQKDFGITFNEEPLFEERFHAYLNLVKEKGLAPFPFFHEILQKYSHVDFYVLTSNREIVIHEILSYWNLTNRFQKVISTAKGQMSKKDVLENSTAYLGTASRDIVLFEDVDRNLKLAYEQNITAIGIEHQFNKGYLLNCDAVFETIT